jgi:creatinine amidohydrolase
MKIRLGDMRWPEVEEVLKKPNVVILPTGSTEQHGRHLPVNFDSTAATHIAEKVARKVTDETKIHVLVAPAINYGETLGTPPFSKLLPGSVGISADTARRLIEEVVRGLLTQGFNNILVINGHLENTIPIAAALRKLSIEFPGSGMYASNWWFVASEAWETVSKGGKEGKGHGCERETVVALVIDPENVDLSVAVKGSHVTSLPEKYTSPLFGGPIFYNSRLGGVRASGLMGDPTASTKETGEKFLEATVNEFSKIVKAIAESEGMTFEEKP